MVSLGAMIIRLIHTNFVDTWLQPFGELHVPGYDAVGHRKFDFFKSNLVWSYSCRLFSAVCVVQCVWRLKAGIYMCCLNICITFDIKYRCLCADRTIQFVLFSKFSSSRRAYWLGGRERFTEPYKDQSNISKVIAFYHCTRKCCIKHLKQKQRRL